MKNKLLTLFLALAASVGTLFAQSGTCGDNLTWTLDTKTGTLTISGTGAMKDYVRAYDNYNQPAPWSTYRNSIVAIIIGNGVTSIGSWALYSCSLTSVAIPNSVTSIGYGAFEGCSSLASIDIPASITSIGGYAFRGCTSLTSVTIPNGVTSIGDYTFNGCNSLTYIEIPTNVTRIGYGAFEGCPSLASIVIPNNVTSIGGSAFGGCSSLTSIEIPNSVKIIGEYSFRYCSRLTSIEIPNSVKSIGQSAFAGCTYLENIVIGSGVTSNGIGSGAFANCPYLMSVICKAEYPPVINANVFEGCGVLGGIDLYVPEKSVARYKKADVWSEFNIVGKDLSVDDPTNPTNPENGKFTITWQDEDGNVIKTDEVEQGTTPAFTGTTPTKPATNEYTYEFAGWLPKIQPATKDMYYTTFFERNKIETPVYTVNINGENCSLNINNQYPEGTVITLEAVADECFEFRQWSDGNTDNPRTITVTANTNLTAEFNKVRYTVTGQPSTGGKVQIRKQ